MFSETDEAVNNGKVEFVNPVHHTIRVDTNFVPT